MENCQGNKNKANGKTEEHFVEAKQYLNTIWRDSV